MVKYLKDSLTYTADGRLLTSNGYSVMMDWEDDIMRESAKVICENGGRILNVGFGMGIIDTYIQTYPIKEHWIIEPHPDVLKYMRENGWYDKPNVHIIEKRWQDVLYDLPTFDGIFFDTWADIIVTEKLIPRIPKLLNKGGIFSLFGYYYTECLYDKKIQKFTQLGLDVSYVDVELNNIPDESKQGKIYWNANCNTYRILRIQDNKKIIKPTHLI